MEEGAPSVRRVGKGKGDGGRGLLRVVRQYCSVESLRAFFQCRGVLRPGYGVAAVLGRNAGQRVFELERN